MSLVLVAFASVIIAALVGSFAGPIGRGLHLLDYPDGAGGRKLHTRVTPLVGGLALVLAVGGAIFVALALTPTADHRTQAQLVWLGVAVASMFVVGAVDDRSTISPLIRLGLSTLVLSVVVNAVPDFTLADLRFTGGGHLSLIVGAGLFSLLCLVGLLNSVNMADGKNGIVISLGLIWSAVLWPRLPDAMHPILAATAAALTVLLWFNMRNKLFLGDGGGYALSTLFGLLAIFSYNRGVGGAHADDVILMFAIPVIDTLRLIVWRKCQGKSPFAGGRDHLHHYLFAAVGWPRGLWIYVALVALPNLGGLAFPGTAPVWLLLSAAAYGLILLRTVPFAVPEAVPSTVVPLRRVPDVRPVGRATLRGARLTPDRRSSRARL